MTTRAAALAARAQERRSASDDHPGGMSRTPRAGKHRVITRPVPDALRRAQTMVAPRLRELIGPPSDGTAQVIGYHLGWIGPDGRPAAGGGGKAVRPALAVLSAEAAGAPAQVGLPGAVAVELVHSFSLLHDDVMDGDETRHHRPTAWRVFGAGRAILAGDDLLVLAMVQLLDAPEHGDRAARSLAAASRRLVVGQAEDLDFEARSKVTPDQYLAMAGGKTGALFGCSASIGAILAGAEESLAFALADFGFHLGLAFQAVDDLLGIWGRPEITGKPAGSDLRKRKKSLPVVLALADGGAAGRRLSDLLGAEEALDAEDLELAAKLIAAAGGREGTRAAADAELGRAVGCLQRASVPGPVLGELEEVARFVADREH